MNTETVIQPATDYIVIKIDDQQDFRVDHKTFELSDNSISVTAREGRGGNMEPKQDLFFSCPGYSGHYAFDALLNAMFQQHSDMYFFKYAPINGGGAVVMRNPAAAHGAFSMEMKLFYNSGPIGIIVPELIRVHVAFNFDLNPQT